MTTPLSPVQKTTYERLIQRLPLFPIVGVTGSPGLGKTTLLAQMHRQLGGEWFAIKDLLHAMRAAHPLAIEETFERLVGGALERAEHVFVDDLTPLLQVTQGCGAYPRAGFMSAVLESLTRLVEAGNKKLLFAGLYAPNELHKKGIAEAIAPFEPDDYAFFCCGVLGDAVGRRLDYRKIHRFARNVNAYDLRSVCTLLRGKNDLTTDAFIDSLRSFGLASNVDLGEVQQVTLADLKGVDHVIESLEANVIVPMERMELADELGLKPKRGVLLAGPPGTGKTTVGRVVALAHRLKSKFFLIDGTCISGTSNFYSQVQRVFEEAKHNSPAIIFVDDSDVIFESGEEMGLYRYLLTMLDGLESATAGQVCVIMTAMDVAHIPPALIRSGRIELWLEMRLPDAAARGAIFDGLFRGQAAVFQSVDRARLVEAADGFTGADLKRLVDDGKNLYAYDRVRKLPLLPTTDYFLKAIDSVRENKTRYAEADMRARGQRKSRPVYFDGNAGEEIPY